VLISAGHLICFFESVSFDFRFLEKFPPLGVQFAQLTLNFHGSEVTFGDEVFPLGTDGTNQFLVGGQFRLERLMSLDFARQIGMVSVVLVTGYLYFLIQPTVNLWREHELCLPGTGTLFKIYGSKEPVLEPFLQI
jgi:hypothetical protein